MMSRSLWLTSILVFGYAFLYVPIALMIGLSFNENPLASVWSGFSVKWYGELIHNESLIDAARLSLEIAAISATIASVLGTVAGFILVRLPRFVGRSLFIALVAMPLVMPEVIGGLSMLLLFVSMHDMIGWPQDRGSVTIAVAHVSFTMAYVAVVVRSRLEGFDRSVEEAALDLGAPPWKVFFVITLPLIMPAVMSGWLLAFTLSLDDVVMSGFVSGPGSTTLPIYVFSQIRRGVSPQINALATLVVLTVTVGIVIAGTLSVRSARRDMAMRDGA